MFKGKIKISGSQELLNAYLAALQPEKEFKTERARYDLKQVKNTLLIKIEAKDATAFRALMGSITGLLAIVEKNWKLRR